MPRSLADGTEISHYRITSRLGAGGMGEVYEAFDTTLERTVALKILPPELVSNEERVRRFILEAKSASALSHPNIVTIHEVGQAEDDAELVVHFLAMELVRGETLRRKIYGEKRDLRGLLGYLAQSADGLAKAHAAGIIHRDLKPENIMVTDDGFAKVLDFGLAKLREPAGATKGATQDPTAVKEQTREGAVLGTVGYMAPEQVEGKRVDHRADIFSFGCILYEAITRQKPFTGESDVDTMHGILHSEPRPIHELAPDVPSELRRMVRRCLAKDPEKRYQSMKDLAIELRDLVDEYDELSIGSDSRPSSELIRPVPLRRRTIVTAAVAIVALVGAGLLIGLLLTRGETSPSGPVAAMRLTPVTTSGKVVSAVISPDGRYIVYVREDRGSRSVYLKQTATGSEVPILSRSDELAGASFAFTRDGDYLYMSSSEWGRTSGTLSLIPTLGGVPRPLIRDLSSGVTLSPDEKRLAFFRFVPSQQESRLVVANVDGSDERVIASRGGKEFFGGRPSWSPDGRWIAASAGTSEGGLNSTILLLAPDGKTTKRLVSEWWFAFSSLAWVPDGTGLITSGQNVESEINQIWFVSYPEGLVRRVTNDLNSYGGISVTADGKSALTVQRDDRSRVWKSDGERIVPVTSEAEKNTPRGFDLARDGSLIYDSIVTGNLDLWRLFPSGERRQLTTHEKADYNPRVSPDGSRVYFQTERSGDAEFWSMDPSGADQRFLARVGQDVDWGVSPDGEWLVYSAQETLWRISTKGGTPERIISHLVRSPRYSPDGRWIAGFFRLDPPPEPLRLCLMPATGGAPKEVAPLQPTAARDRLRWSPSGDAIGYVNIVDGIDNIWLQPSDGSPARAATDFDSGIIFSFDWDQDGVLWVTRGSWTADAVLITDFR